MRIGELATATGVPIATLKYYLREGLLHGGAATAVNQAQYDDTHVQRVRLLRALLQMGHLSIADTQRVIAAAEDEGVGTHDMFAVAQDALVPPADRSGPRYPAARAEVDRLVERHGLRVRPDAQSREMLADALVAMAEFLGLPPTRALPTDAWDEVMGALLRLAGYEVGSVPDIPSRAAMTEYMANGTVVLEVGLGALRRMALEHASAERFAAPRQRRRASSSKRSP